MGEGKKKEKEKGNCCESKRSCPHVLTFLDGFSGSLQMSRSALSGYSGEGEGEAEEGRFDKRMRKHISHSGVVRRLFR